MASGRQDETSRTTGIERGVARRRWARVEAERDRQWLEWIGRFRFVTAELIGLRFGVNVPNARRRLRRLAGVDLVSIDRSGFGEASVAVLTPKGAQLVDQPRRQREPRPDLHRDHELAIVEFVARLELAAGDRVRALTERDCRRLAADGGRRYSVGVIDRHGRRGDRWPDVVMVAADGAVAVEIEFAPKDSDRLARILRGYLLSDLKEVRFLVASPRLARRLHALAGRERARLPLRHQERAPGVVIDAWSGAAVADRDAIRAQAA
jgi:hypothetical protein